MSWNGILFIEYITRIFVNPKVVSCQHRNFPEAITIRNNSILFLRAEEFLENLTGSSSHSEFQILSLLSREFPRKALECDDTHSKVIAPAALVYLVSLHFASSRNQIRTRSQLGNLDVSNDQHGT